MDPDTERLEAKPRRSTRFIRTKKSSSAVPAAQSKAKIPKDELMLAETTGEAPKPEETEPLTLPENVPRPEIPEGRKLKQYIATLAVCLGAFTAGTFLSWTSSALPQLAKNGTENPLGEPITDNQGMWIGSLLAIGALFTAFPIGFLADRFGRKIVLICLSSPCIISWIIVIFAEKVEALYGARLLAGFAVGGICATTPLYIGEIAEKSIRGALGSCFQLLLTVGILYSYIIGAYCNYMWLGICCGIPPLLYLLCTIIIPETPYYFITKGKVNLAEKSLRWLRGQQYNTGPQIQSIEDEVNEARKSKGNCKELVATKANKMALFLSLGLMFFQQLCGINAVIFYTAQIFSFAGTDLLPSTCAIIVGCVQVGSTITAIFLVDRVGRRILLLLSGSIMGLCLVVFGIYFYLKDHNESVVEDIGWIPLFTINIYILCFSLGFGPLPWMMMGELFPSSIKGLASGLSVTLNWLLVFAVTKTFQDLVNGLGTWGTFWFFGCITFVGVFFVIIFVKETKGKSFGEIHKMLGG